MEKICIEFENNIERVTSLDVYSEKSDKPQALAIFIHGFRAFKDWGFIPYICKGLASSDMMAGAIDFSMNVVADREKMWFDMDLFRKNTITQEVTEIKMLLHKIVSGEISLPNAWNGEIYLIGHSLGGAIAILSAENEMSVRKLATICSIYDMDIYTNRQKEQWLATGKKEFVDSTTGQKIVLDVGFLLDRLEYVGQRALKSVVSYLNIPYLVLHTTADATVNPQAATILADAVSDKQLVEVKMIQGNHQLNSQHPFIETNAVVDNVICILVDFFSK